MNAEEVCREITVQTDRFYREIVIPALEALAVERKDPLLRPAGYTVLFGPPIVGAEAFFIGFQPGGGPENGEDEQPASREPMWPEPTSYAVQDWQLARVMRGIFGVEFLRICTGANLQFFRAASDKVYAKWPLALRVQTQEFSRKQLGRLIDTLTPKKIVCIGKKTFLSLMPTGSTTAQGDRDRFLLGEGTYKASQAIGCVHLTGAQITKKDRSIVNAGLRRFVGVSASN